MHQEKRLKMMIEAGTSFLDAWAAGDSKDAYSWFDPETQEEIGEENWSKIVNTMTNEGTLPKEWEFEDWEIIDLEDGTNWGKISGWVTTKGLKKLELSLIWLVNRWTIEGFAFE